MARGAANGCHGLIVAALALLSLAVAASPVRLHSRNHTTERLTAMTKNWASGKCTGTERLAGLDGRTEAQLRDTLGEPTRTSSFRLGDKQDEFHIALQNHYPLKKPENAKVELREWTWQSHDCRLTVWLHKAGADWVALENLRYNAETEF